MYLSFELILRIINNECLSLFLKNFFKIGSNKLNFLRNQFIMIYIKIIEKVAIDLNHKENNTNFL